MLHPDALRPLRLRSPAGLEADILPYGARLAALRVATPGGLLDTVLGYPDPAGYLEDRGYLGAAIGRVSGRIGNARFLLDGHEVRLTTNHGRHHHHGGVPGLHARCWTVDEYDTTSAHRLVLATTSPAGECGYPGEVVFRLTFTIDGLSLRLDMEAACDAPTPLALTYHPYFNLGGPEGKVRDHQLQLAAEEWLEVDDELIPTGTFIQMRDTPFDFRTPRRIGDARRFDHTFVLRHGRPWDARAWHPVTGLALEVSSDQPGLQFYDGQWLEPIADARWRAGDGFCLEPQGFPDAVNRPGFPPPWLRPGERYHRWIRYAFAQEIRDER